MTTRSATLGVAHGPDLHAAHSVIAPALAAVRRDLLWLYLAIFGFFRCYPMYLSPGRKARAAHAATAAASARS
jgi:hypothetical protein